MKARYTSMVVLSLTVMFVWAGLLPAPGMAAKDEENSTGARTERGDRRGGHEGRGGRRGHGLGGPEGGYGRRWKMMRERHAEFLEWLKKNYPVEAERIGDSENRHPQASVKLMTTSIKKLRHIFEAEKENPALAEVLKEKLELRKQQYKLVKKTRQEENTEHKEALKRELVDLMNTRFDLIVREKELRYESLLKRLKELENEVKQSRARISKMKDPAFKEQKIEARLKEVLGGDTERSDRRGRGGPEGRGGGRWGGPGRGGSGGEHRRGWKQMHQRHAEFLEWLKKNYPGEAERIGDSESRHPQTGAKRMTTSMRRLRQIFEAEKENPALAEVLKEKLELRKQQNMLVKKIHQEKNAERKEDSKRELAELMNARFDLIVRGKELKYESLLKRLKELENEVKQSRAKISKMKDPAFKEQKIKARLEELLGQAENFKWE